MGKVAAASLPTDEVQQAVSVLPGKNLISQPDG